MTIKAKTKKAKAAKPTSGKRRGFGYNHDDKLDLRYAQLNFTEKRIVDVLRDTGEPLTPDEIAKAGFPQVRGDARPKSESKSRHPAYRRVMNGLRRVVSSGYGKRVEPQPETLITRYQATDKKD